MKFRTSLEKEVIISLLKEKIRAKQSPKLRLVNREIVASDSYEGHIDKNGFNIKRSINYRNSFLPLIEGKFEQAASGTHVLVTMRLSPFVLVFMALWIGILLLASLAALISILNNLNSFDFYVLIPLVMLVFGYGMTIIGFKYESKKSVQFFEEILKTKQTSFLSL